MFQISCKGFEGSLFVWTEKTPIFLCLYSIVATWACNLCYSSHKPPYSLSNLTDPTITSLQLLQRIDMNGKGTIYSQSLISTTHDRNPKEKCEILLIRSPNKTFSLASESLKLHNAIRVQWTNYRFINLYPKSLYHLDILRNLFLLWIDNAIEK